MVKEKMKQKNENDPKIKTNHVQIPVTATTQSILTKRNFNTSIIKTYIIFIILTN